MLLLQCSAPCITSQWHILLLLNKWPCGRGQKYLLQRRIKKKTKQNFPLQSSAIHSFHDWKNELSLHLVTECVAAFPQQQGAENSNDAQVETEAEEECPHGPQEGRQHPVGDQHRFPRHHVGDDSLHLEVRPHHSADVEELVAVACETKSLRWKRATTCNNNNGARPQDAGFISSLLPSAPKSPKIWFAAKKTCKFCCFFTV